MPTPAAASLDLPAAAAASRDLCASAATYPARPEHVRQARADARGLLDGCPAADEVILCLSELAANAVLHSDSRRPGGTFTVRIESCPGGYIRIEVDDGGGPWLAPAPTRAAAAGLTSSACSRPNGASPPAPQAAPSGLVSTGPASSTASASLRHAGLS